MGNTGVIFGIVGLWCAFLALRSWIQLKSTGDIKKSVLYPTNNTNLVMRCKDKEGYIKETLPKLLILGIVAGVYGIVEIINATVMPMKGLLIASMIVSGVVLVWAGIGAKKMNDKYF